MLLEGIDREEYPAVPFQRKAGWCKAFGGGRRRHP